MSGDLSKPFDPFEAAKSASSKPSATAPPGEFHAVELPSGAVISVPNEEEARYLGRLVDGYREDYDLRNVADLSELDRCIGLELQMHRIQVWISQRRDYDGKTVDENALMQRQKETSAEIRQIKKLLGIDRVARDRQFGKGSAAERVNNILARARQFGLMRNEQQAKAIELANQLIAMWTARSNCTSDKELRRLAVTDEDIFEWIETVFIPEFQRIDADYRAGNQSMWILQDA